MTIDITGRPPRIIAPGGPVSRAVAAMRHEPEPPRRGFLRGLLTLPLLGGAVSLIGAPSAVAEPVTPRLLATYSDWLLLERRRLHVALFPDPAERSTARSFLIGADTAANAFHLPIDGQAGSPAPSTRAALVLSTVGCDWREGGR